MLSRQQDKEKARHLIVKEGKLQKEVAALLGVSEKSIGIWVNKYGWRKKMDSNLYECEDPLLAYLRFLQTEYPDTYQAIQTTFVHFQKQQQDASNKI